MKMGFRWYGKGNDTITLEHIRQIPGVEGIVWALHDIPAGEEWPMSRILEVKEQIEAHGFQPDVVESLNVHEDIKLGLPSRDLYIENYKKTLVKLAACGVKVVCYNFMPVFDWVRTDLNYPHRDGSTSLFYERRKIEQGDPQELVQKMCAGQKLTIPGWEPERLQELATLFEAYEFISEERLRENLAYFLREVIPVAEENGMTMAIHPDDPPWPVFGLPRIVKNEADLRDLLAQVDSPANGFVLCSGALGADKKNDLLRIAETFFDRIPFVHLRNVKVFANGDFMETSHRRSDGSVDIPAILRVLHKKGFSGYVRPDHGRHLWGEKCRPGYGLYDRALGIMYLWGIWDALEGGAMNV